MMIFLYMSAFSFAWEVKSNSNGETLHWKESQIAFYINSNESPLSKSDTELAMTNAAKGWNFSHTELLYKGITNLSGINHQDEHFIVSFDTSWSEDPDILALTYTWSNSEGEIVHFDIEVNAEDHDWSIDGDANKHDLQNTITHEFGHVLGLDHSTIPDATMSPSAPTGELSKRELHEDDLLGYKIIYPEPLTAESQESSTENNNNGSSTSYGGGGTSPPQTTGEYGLTMPTASCAHQEAPSNWAILLLALLGLRKKQSVRV